MAESVCTDDEIRLLSDQYWRLNNLYQIVDDDGRVIPFKMKLAQEALYWDLWFRTIVLKARQHGFSTFLALYALDSVLFNDQFAAGIIAHTLPDAQKIFRRKIQFAYQHLPDWVKAITPAVTKEASDEYVFENGSSISVSTSFRGGTLQFLHVSEMGKIAAKHPHKAEEIKTGAFEAVPKSGVIVVESTAEGNHGEFKDLVDRAVAWRDTGKPLTSLSWRLHFVPWYKDPKYKLTTEETKATPIPQRMLDYFAKVEEGAGIQLTPRQRAWYVAKEANLGEMMWREYPSDESEPFKVSLDGAYFAAQMTKARRDGRITKVPHTEGIPVDTWWDIGRDTTSIWFTQDIGMLVHCIGYYQNSGEGLRHYVEKTLDIARERGFRYGQHNLPHDAGVRDYSNREDKTREMVANDMGLRPTNVCPRMKDKEDGIEAGRNFIQHCVFDEEACEEGIAGLDAYRKEWDEKHGVWKSIPLHDWASHPADAFQQLALFHKTAVHKQSIMPQARPVKPGRRFG